MTHPLHTLRQWGTRLFADCLLACAFFGQRGAMFGHPPRPFSGQRGAMFGMDARIALIIASVLAATGGIALMSRLDRSKVDATDEATLILRDGIMDYYENIGITEFPQNIEVLFVEGLVEDPLHKRDAFGSDWNYSYFTENITVEGQDIAMKFGVLFSSGKDGIPDSLLVTNMADYTDWAPRNDDVGIKLSSRDIELARLEEFRARGQLIVDKLTTAESSNYLGATGVCESNTPAEWCTENDGKNYTQFNFYPKSDLDDVDAVIYYTDNQDGVSYSAGNIDDMENLMETIGLPRTYAQDPWRRVLFYHSNVTKRENPPFTASICYSYSGSCF